MGSMDRPVWWDDKMTAAAAHRTVYPCCDKSLSTQLSNICIKLEKLHT
jgi:hypothetical protein